MRKLLLLFFCFITTLLEAQQPRLVLPIGHTGTVKKMLYTKNNKFILTAGANNVILWDAQTQKQLITYKGHTDFIIDFSLSIDETKLLTSSQDNSIKLWDFKTGKLLLHLAGESQGIFSRDGKNSASVSPDKGIINIRNITTGKIIFKLNHGSEIKSFCITSDGYQLFTGGIGSEIKQWDIRTGKLLKGFKVEDWLTKIVISFNDKFIAVVGSRYQVFILDINSGKWRARLQGHAKGIMDVKFSPDGTKIVSSSTDNTAKLWDVQTGKLILDLHGHTNSVNYSTFSNDPKKILTCSTDRTAILWDSDDGKILKTFIGHIDKVYVGVFNNDGNKIITGSSDNTAMGWDVLSGKEIFKLEGKSLHLTGLKTVPNTKKISIRSEDGNVRIWDTQKGELNKVFGNHTLPVNSVFYLSDPMRIITYGNDRKLKIWDASDFKLLYSINTAVLHVKSSSPAVHLALLSPDKKSVLTYYHSSYENPPVRAYNPENGEWLFDIDISGSLKDISFSEDSKIIYTKTFGDDSLYKTWNANNGRLTGTQSILHTSLTSKLIIEETDFKVLIRNKKDSSVLGVLNDNYGIKKVLLSPDSSQIFTFSGYNDLHIKVWNASTFKLISDDELPLEGFHNIFSFTPDGNQLLIGSTSISSLILWDFRKKKYGMI